MRVCPYCSLSFIPTRLNKLYCDDLCQQRAKSERRSVKPSRRAYMRAWKQKRRLANA